MPRPLAALLVAVLSSLAALPAQTAVGAPTLTAGVVPGRTEARIAAAAPGGLALLLLGPARGHTALPGGLALDLVDPAVAAVAPVDAGGDATMTARFPAHAGRGAAFVAQGLVLAPDGTFAVTAASDLCVPAVGAEVDVVVLFGQSNAEGYAQAADLPPALRGPLPQARVWNELQAEWQPLQAGVNNTTLLHPDWCGPELALCTGLAESGLSPPGRVVHLVKFAVGQTALGPTPGPWNEWNVAAGELYAELVRRVGNACAALRAQGLEPRVRGVCMMQGESDALEEQWARGYGARLRELVVALRDELWRAGSADGAEVPFAIGLIHPELPTEAFAFVDEVRAAQREVAAALPRCRVVETAAFARQHDRVHFATPGATALGRAFAAALLAEAGVTDAVGR